MAYVWSVNLTPKISLLELNRSTQGTTLAGSTKEHVQLILDAVATGHEVQADKHERS